MRGVIIKSKRFHLYFVLTSFARFEYGLASWLGFLSLDKLLKNLTAQNAITSSSSPRKEEEERSSIVADQDIKTKSATCFALRGDRFTSSSRLMVLSLLGCKDGTRTIEMILVSTVLTSDR